MLSLEEFTHLGWKVYLLGYKSSAMTKCLFNTFVSTYEGRQKEVREQAQMLLPSEETSVGPAVKSREEIHLQECLIVCFWMLVESVPEDNLPLEDMLRLIPLRAQSSHPMIIEIATNINHALKPTKAFPRIKCQECQAFSSVHDQYYGKMKGVSSLLMLEAKESGKFIHNYCPASGKYIR